MKKMLFVVLAILIIAVTGCGQKVADEPVKKYDEPKAAPARTVTEYGPAADEPAASGYEDEPVVETAPAKVPSKAVQDLLKKHERVKSLSYMYQDQINYPGEWKTYVMGSKVHLELYTQEEITGDTYVDNIYLNTATKSAKGYCETKVYRCADPNQEVSVRYEKYARKTPLDWIKGVTYAEKGTAEQMQQRSAVRLFYTDEDGNEVTMWVDEYYGVPMQVFVKKGGDTKKYIFEDLAVNGVEETDLDHQFVKEVYRD